MRNAFIPISQETSPQKGKDASLGIGTGIGIQDLEDESEFAQEQPLACQPGMFLQRLEEMMMDEAKVEEDSFLPIGEE